MSVGLFVLGILHAAMWDTPMSSLIAANSVAPQANLTVANLTVEVTLEREDGVVRLGLFDCQTAYRADQPVKDAHLTPNDDGSVTVTFRGLAPGTYAVKGFQDLDGDAEIDTNLVGYPTEPFGFSNDAPVRFGPPSFRRAAFTVSASGAQHRFSLH